MGLNDGLLGAINAGFPQIPVSGSQNMAGWFCGSTVNNANSNKLVVLYGGIGTNREYWTALGGTTLGFSPLPTPPQYSLVTALRCQGYTVLALDHLGQGKSSHPDPVQVVERPYE